MEMPQIEPVSNMVKDHRGLLARVKRGPIFLVQRSRPAAVLASPEEWSAKEDRIAQLERIVEADRHFPKRTPASFLHKNSWINF